MYRFLLAIILCIGFTQTLFATVINARMSSREFRMALMQRRMVIRFWYSPGPQMIPTAVLWKTAPVRLTAQAGGHRWQVCGNTTIVLR